MTGFIPDGYEMHPDIDMTVYGHDGYENLTLDDLLAEASYAGTNPVVFVIDDGMLRPVETFSLHPGGPGAVIIG